MNKKLTTIFIAFTFMLGAVISFSVSADERDDILVPVLGYLDAINEYDVPGMMSHFTEDAHVMQNGGMPLIGLPRLTEAYGSQIGAMEFDIDHEVLEVVQMGSDWAFVQLHGNGKITLTSNGMVRPQELSELFIVRKTSMSGWKIARYTFHSTRSLGPG